MKYVYQRVLAGRERTSESQRERSGMGKWVATHSRPTLARDPVEIAFAWRAPYLLALAFPRCHAISAIRDDRPVATASADFTAEPAKI